MYTYTYIYIYKLFSEEGQARELRSSAWGLVQHDRIMP